MTTPELFLVTLADNKDAVICKSWHEWRQYMHAQPAVVRTRTGETHTCLISECNLMMLPAQLSLRSVADVLKDKHVLAVEHTSWEVLDAALEAMRRSRREGLPVAHTP